MSRSNVFFPPPQPPSSLGHDPLAPIDLVCGDERAKAMAEAAVERERARAGAQRTKQRRHVKDMEKLGYEVFSSEPDGTFTFKKVTTWHEETAAPSCAGGQRETSGSSLGPSEAALASAQRALRNAKKLKQSSANGSARADAKPGRVIPLKS